MKNLRRYIRALWFQFRLTDFRCRLWGHAFDAIAAEYYSVYVCDRCGHRCHQYNWRERIRGNAWLLKDWLKGWQIGWREWLKCSECGGRFRHTYPIQISFGDVTRSQLGRRRRRSR